MKTVECAYNFTGENTQDGPSRTPHGLKRVTGGSSGGSGAAVAGGLLPMGVRALACSRSPRASIMSARSRSVDDLALAYDTRPRRLGSGTDARRWNRRTAHAQLGLRSRRPGPADRRRHASERLSRESGKIPAWFSRRDARADSRRRYPAHAGHAFRTPRSDRGRVRSSCRRCWCVKPRAFHPSLYVLHRRLWSRRQYGRMAISFGVQIVAALWRQDLALRVATSLARRSRCCRERPAA
jgi:Amidase